MDDFPYLAREFKKRAALLEAQNHRCAYCGIRLHGKPDCHDSATIDEIIPRSKGGKRVWSNQVMACFQCNGGRGDLCALIYFNNVQSLGRDGAYRWACRARILVAGGKGARKIWSEQRKKEMLRQATRPIILPRHFMIVE